MRRGAKEGEVIGQRGKATGPVGGQLQTKYSREIPRAAEAVGRLVGKRQILRVAGDVDDLRVGGIYCDGEIRRSLIAGVDAKGS
jgi:hypothetical protein